jgi:FdhD protein
MAEHITVRRRIFRLDGDQVRETLDTLAAEEPLEIRVGGQAVAVTMRTPGDDFDLAAGFCLSEGLLGDPEQIEAIRYCAGTDSETGQQTYNVVDIALRNGGTVVPDLRRNVYTTSSCGICGTASIEAIRTTFDDITDPVRVSAGVLRGLPETMLAAQRVFDRTGGLHAAGRFTASGQLLDLREDVGRHNAVDKVIGHAALAGHLPLTGQILLVSGRVAFEIVQKALGARIPVVAAVSAPTSLAVEAASAAGMTLVGFLRGDRMNIYAGGERIA